MLLNLDQLEESLQELTGRTDGIRQGKEPNWQKEATNVVSHFEGAVHLLVHPLGIECHEVRVDDDAQRDEELGERVVDEKVDELLELDPVSSTSSPTRRKCPAT